MALPQRWRTKHIQASRPREVSRSVPNKLQPSAPKGEMIRIKPDTQGGRGPQTQNLKGQARRPSKLVTWAFGPALCTTYNGSTQTGTYQYKGTHPSIFRCIPSDGIQKEDKLIPIGEDMLKETAPLPEAWVEEALSITGIKQGRSVPRRLNLSNIEEVSESRSPSSQEPFTVKSPNSTPVPPARPGRRIPVSIVELEDNFSEPKIHTKSPRVQSPAVRTPSAQSPRVQSPAVRTSYTQSIHVQSPAAGATYAHSLSVQTPSLGKPYVQSSRTPGHPQDMPSFSWSKYTSPKPPTPPKYPTAARELFPETQETYCQTRSPFPLPTEKTPRYQFSNPPMTTQCIAASPRSRLTTPRTQPHVPTSGTSTRRAIPIKVQEIPITPFHASSRAPVTSEEKTEAVDEIIRKYQSSKDKSTKITAAPMECPYDKRAQEIMDILKRHRRDEMVTPSSAGPLRSTSIQRIVERYATPASVYTNTVDNLKHYEDDGGEASGDLEVTEEEELYEEEYGVCGEEGDFDNGQKESAIKRFDLSVRAELKRRKDDPDHILDILVESPFSTRHEEGIGGPFGQALRLSIAPWSSAYHHCTEKIPFNQLSVALWSSTN
uniref:Uncharacterized protein n=1 Tax=Timema cristinae TaxID=61476 RepID=A0A7R9D5W2_TIMCR|nr:unnamed protein product [Timema cristinae]